MAGTRMRVYTGLLLLSIANLAWAAAPGQLADDGTYGYSKELIQNATARYLSWLDENTFGFHDSFYVGNITCANFVNSALENATESGKAGSQIATQLMTFIPAVITIANIWAPRSSEAFATSFFVGILSATYRLGLPIKSVSGVPLQQSLSIGDLTRARLEKIYDYGGLMTEGHFLRLPWHTHRGPQAFHFTLADFYAWFDPSHLPIRNGLAQPLRPSAEKFLLLKQSVEDFTKRHHRWYMPKHLIAFSQFAIMFVVLWPATQRLTFFPIWQCNRASVYWLLALAAVSIIVQTCMWEMSDHERVKIWRLPSLRRVEYLLDEADPELDTVATHIPPLVVDIPPWISVARAAVKLFFRVSYIVRHPISAAMSDSARRKPIIALIYLKASGQHPVKRALVGFLQGIFLILLTFFFGTYWGGNVIRTLGLLLIMLTVITAGRLLGIAYIRWSSKAYGLHVIECEDKTQIRGTLRVLTCMGKNILVEVNGAMYVNGIRVDSIPDFRRYLNDLEQGKFDADDVPPKKRKPSKGGKSSKSELALSKMESPEAGQAVQQEQDMYHDVMPATQPHEDISAGSVNNSESALPPAAEGMPDPQAVSPPPKEPQLEVNEMASPYSDEAVSPPPKEPQLEVKEMPSSHPDEAASPPPKEPQIEVDETASPHSDEAISPAKPNNPAAP